VDDVTVARWLADGDLHPWIRPVVAVQDIDVAIVPIVLVRDVACGEPARAECGHSARRSSTTPAASQERPEQRNLLHPKKLAKETADAVLRPGADKIR
jgi:hypothetical protein